MQIELSNRFTLTGLSQDQRDKIKDSLTFDNPAYASAKRFSPYKYVAVPPYLTYYNEASVRTSDGDRKKVLSVPSGIDLCSILETSNLTISDQRITVPIKYPPFKLELRTDQSESVANYMWEIKKSARPKQIVSMFTGKGKTILALYIASKLGQKTLVLVHKDDLVVGWKADIEKCFGKINVGLIKAKSRKVGSLITIATVQTLNRMGSEELSTYTKQFGLVIQDECHHVGLNIFNIIDQFHAKYRLGLSATPFRSDGLNFVFDLFFGGICFKQEAVVDDEDISSVEVRVLDSGFKYRPFLYKGRVFNSYDYDTKELPRNIQYVEDIPYKDRPRILFQDLDNQAVLNNKTKIQVCRKVLEHYRQGHSCLVLFTQKEHINSYYRYLRVFVPEERILLYYGDSKEKTDIMMDRAERKEVLITLATYAKTTEGTNVKSWEVQFLVSSMNNEKNVEQAVGRVRRKKEGKLNPVIVYDIRYSQSYSLRSHYRLRQSVYNRLKFKIVDKGVPQQEKSSSRSVFSRGYKH